MNKLKKHKLNKKPFFIKGYYINTKICDDLIKWFEKNTQYQTEGKVYVKGGDRMGSKDKKSTDISINPDNQDPLIQNYLHELGKAVEMYKKDFQFCDDKHEPWSIVEGFNIQRYRPKEGFYTWHYERGQDPISIKRHLVFMTYLNTVKSGGQTAYFHQKLKVNAEKGLTVIWPSEWMYLHRGVLSKKETKYIATGWWSYNK